MQLSDCELSGIQDALDALYDKDCIVKRVTSPTRVLGVTTGSLATIETTRCRLSQPSASQLAAYAEKLGALALWQVKMPLAMKEVVRASDTLTIEGRDLLVQRLLTPRSMEFQLIVLASEVR